MLIWQMIFLSSTIMSFFGLPILRSSLLKVNFFACLEKVALLQPSSKAIWL
uniref:Uncharacterized protein n=1 Tax=Physcomitrium patens TaxID=3218 RepID=A0A2K1K4M6_PHYPA|nr:hypothetical protein PHYPA_013197 [Physcomitrium patens]